VVRTFEGRQGSIVGVDFSPDGKQLLCAESWGSEPNLHNRLALLDVNTAATVRVLKTHAREFMAMNPEFSQDGRWIVTNHTGRLPGMIREHVVISARTGQEVLRFGKPMAMMDLLNTERAWCFSPDGQWFLCPGEKDNVDVWSMAELARRIQASGKKNVK